MGSFCRFLCLFGSGAALPTRPRHPARRTVGEAAAGARAAARDLEGRRGQPALLRVQEAVLLRVRVEPHRAERRVGERAFEAADGGGAPLGAAEWQARRLHPGH